MVHSKWAQRNNGSLWWEFPLNELSLIDFTQSEDNLMSSRWVQRNEFTLSEHNLMSSRFLSEYNLVSSRWGQLNEFTLSEDNLMSPRLVRTT